MISRFALVFAKHFASREVYGHEKINVYRYGFELLLSTVMNLLGLLIISMLLSVPIGAILFCMAFIPLRLAAGGYHAKHHWSCILEFNLIFLGFAILSQYLPSECVLIYSLLLSVISSIVIWSLAPVEAVNKPLVGIKKEKQRAKSITIACINLAVTLGFCSLKELRFSLPLPLLFFYISGAFAASMSLVAATVAVKKTDHSSTKH